MMKIKIDDFYKSQFEYGLKLGAALGAVQLGIEAIIATAKVIKALVENKKKVEEK